MTIVVPVTVKNEADRTWAKEMIYQALQETGDDILVIDHGSTYLKEGVDHQKIEWKGPQTRIFQYHFNAVKTPKELEAFIQERATDYLVVDPAVSGVPVG